MPTHAEQKILPYTPRQMFDLVADIESYPEFLPWCLDCRIISREDKTIRASLTIGYKFIRETFISEVALHERSKKIDVRYIKGPFKYLNNHWVFRPSEIASEMVADKKAAKKACEVDFFIDFEFGSMLFQKLIGVFFNEAVRMMIAAFEARAHALYDPLQAAPYKTPKGAPKDKK